jgi:hypothetical protein
MPALEIIASKNLDKFFPEDAVVLNLYNNSNCLTLISQLNPYL